MDEASREALSRAFEMEARAGGQPWGLDTILEKATAIRGFLETEGTTEPLVSRVELLEDLIPKILGVERTTLDRLDDLESTLKQSSGRRRTSPDPAKAPSRTSASEETKTTPPDIDVKAPDPVPVDF